MQHQHMKVWREAANEVKEIHNKTILISEKRKGSEIYEEIRKRYENKVFNLKSTQFYVFFGRGGVFVYSCKTRLRRVPQRVFLRN